MRTRPTGSRFCAVLLAALMIANLFLCLPASAQARASGVITPGEQVQTRLEKGTTHTYTLTAAEDQYYRFRFHNQSLEVRTGIGFADGFLNLFVGKMSVAVYDQYDEKLSAFDVRCGYTGQVSLKLTKGMTYKVQVSSSVSGNYNMLTTMLADEGGNIWSEATEVIPTAKITSAIDASGDKDWFRFTADSDRSYYHFSLENLNVGGYAELWLYEYIPGAGETPLREIFDFGVRSGNTYTKSVQLKPGGTYYYVIWNDSGYSGGYVLSTTQHLDAAGSTVEESYEVTFDRTYVSSFDGESDVDYYCFTTKDYEAYYHFNYENLSFSGYTEIKLYDSLGTELAGARPYGTGECSVNAQLQPNTEYYIRLSGNGVGNYQFSVDPKEDPYPSEFGRAKEIKTNTEYHSSYDGTSDVDYMTFVTGAENAQYVVCYESLSFNGYNNIRVYDENENELAGTRPFGTGAVTLSLSLAPQTRYYIYLGGSGVGNYKITVKENLDADGNEPAKATPIKLNQLHESSLEASSDVDWFSVEVPTEKRYRIVLRNENGITISAEVYNERDSRQFGTKLYGEADNYSTGDLDAGNYYIKVSGNNEGYYTVVLAECGGGHSETVRYREATFDENGTEIKYCRYCDSTLKTNTIHAVNNVKLSADSFLYDGQVHLPTVSLKDSWGNQVTSYKVTYENESSALPGLHALTVTLTGNYTGRKTLTYTIKDADTATVFTDVPQDKWFYTNGAVNYAYNNALFAGTGAGKFSPNNNMTRGMVVTVLWRMEGAPVPSGANPFGDVLISSWYGQAVVWAAENGIVTGVSADRFNPTGNVTREQLATILYRYASGKGRDVSASAKLNFFPDAGSVAGYATTALSWANAEGLITGTTGAGGTILNPKGSASRAQVATILMRYLETGMTDSYREGREFFREYAGVVLPILNGISARESSTFADGNVRFNLQGDTELFDTMRGTLSAALGESVTLDGVLRWDAVRCTDGTQREVYYELTCDAEAQTVQLVFRTVG